MPRRSCADALHVYLGGPQRPNTEGFSWGLLSTANTPAPGLVSARWALQCSGQHAAGRTCRDAA